MTEPEPAPDLLPDPCPFCGETHVTATETRDGPVRPVSVTCWSCGASSDVYPNADDAITAWNRRPAQPAVPARDAIVEECARVADSYKKSPDHGCVTCAGWIADDIRALKGGAA
jgi:Lar family restriction alleviation protein